MTDDIDIQLTSSFSLNPIKDLLRFMRIFSLEKQSRKETVIPWVEVEREEKIW